MKYIKLFESFESNILNSVFDYVKKNTNKVSLEAFRSRLKATANRINVPLSDFSDTNIKYVGKKAALEIDGDSDNKTGHYCLKFWFSLDSFLGVTTPGHEEGYGPTKTRINQFGIYKGKIGRKEYVRNYKGLGFYKIDNQFWYGELVYTDHDFYFFQDYKNGSEPYNFNDIKGDWEYSWEVGPNDDFYPYKKSDEELVDKMSELPLNSDLDVSRYHAINLDEADYAVVVYLNDLIGDNLSDKISDRANSKKDAVAFMTDEQIRNINLRNYDIGLFNKYDFVNNFDNLNKVILNLLSDKFIMFRVVNLPNDIVNFIEKLTNVIESNEYNSSDAEFYSDELEMWWLDRKNYSKKMEDKYIINLERLKSGNLSPTLEICMRISEHIFNYYKDKKFTTLKELKGEHYKLNSIYNFSDNLEMNSTRRFMRNMDNTSKYRYEDDMSNIKRENDSLIELERYVKSIF